MVDGLPDPGTGAQLNIGDERQSSHRLLPIDRSFPGTHVNRGDAAQDEAVVHVAESLRRNSG